MISYKKIILFAFMLGSFAACTDRWDEHIEAADPSLSGSVLQNISSNPQLSEFYALLQQSGYDTLISNSRAYTIFAPSNDALGRVDQSILNDPAMLKRFVGNHITNQQYYTHTSLNDTSRVEALNGKFLFWGDARSRVDMENADILAANGVVHILNAPLTPKQSSWEFLMSSDMGTRQAEFLQSLQGQIFVDSVAPQIGVNPDTGEPVYDSLAGMVPYNPFFYRGYDISNEDSLNTFFILTDNAFQNEINEYRKYFNTGRADSTNYFASLAITKDLVFRGMYTEENLPAFLYSKDSVKVSINKSDIVHVEETSNGIVYVLNNLDLPAAEKLKPIRVQGEWAYFDRYGLVSHPEKANTISRRVRTTDEGRLFRDILAYGHGIAGFNILYNVEGVYAATYDVYMTTYNDFNGNTVYKQKLEFDEPTAANFLFKDVPANEYARILVGTITIDRFGNKKVYLVSDAATRDAANALNLDYFELVPVIE